MRRLLTAAAALALGLAAPAFAQETPYEQAVAARLAGDSARAVALLEHWLAEHPGDADARVQLGYALLAEGRAAGAEREFAAVLDDAPDYTDAREGLALARARLSEARRGYLAVEGGLSDGDGGGRQWSEIGLVLIAPVAAGDTMDVQAVHYDRFGLGDTEMGAGYTHRAGRDLWLRAGISVTPGADFRPEIGVRAGADYRIAGGPETTTVGFDASYRKFPLQDVWAVSPAVTQYLAGGRASLTGRLDAVAAEGDVLRLGASVRADYLPSDSERWFLGAGRGPDTDLGVVDTTTSLFGGAEMPVAEGLVLTGSAAREWRRLGVDRTGFRLGIKVAL